MRYKRKQQLTFTLKGKVLAVLPAPFEGCTSELIIWFIKENPQYLKDHKNIRMF